MTDIVSVDPCDLPNDLSAPQNLHIKGFFEEALSKAITRAKPLLYRSIRHRTYLVVDPRAETRSELQALRECAGEVSGNIPGLLAPVTDHHGRREQVRWAEAARMSLEWRNGKIWLLVDPDIWIWPARARTLAAGFMRERRKDRRNEKYNGLLDAWVRIILGTADRNVKVVISAFGKGEGAENPSFQLNSRTAFSRKLQ